VTGPADTAIDLGSLEVPSSVSPVYFVQLNLKDAGGKLLSDNFYWRALSNHHEDLTALDTLKTVNLEATATKQIDGGTVHITVTLHNPGAEVALMTHLQLRRGKPAISEDPLSNGTARVLPVYYSDNYVSLVPNESRTITIEAAEADLKGEAPWIVLDGWNVGVDATASPVPVTLNENAQVSHWPVTGLPIVAHTWK